MKTTFGHLRKIIESLLVETKCPGCGDPEAYVGMNDVECPNRACKFFSEKELDARTKCKIKGKYPNHECESPGDYCELCSNMCPDCGADTDDFENHKPGCPNETTEQDDYPSLRNDCPDCGGGNMRGKTCLDCDVCPECQGTGIDLDSSTPCKECDGSGYIDRDMINP